MKEFLKVMFSSEDEELRDLKLSSWTILIVGFIAEIIGYLKEWDIKILISLFILMIVVSIAILVTYAIELKIEDKQMKNKVE